MVQTVVVTPPSVAITELPTEVEIVLPDTPVLTNTPEPSLTPTETIAPSPTISNIIFENNFSEGFSDEWEVVSGDYNIVDGMLISESNNLLLAYGEIEWTDYEIEVGAVNAFCGEDRANYIAVRWTDD